MVGYIFIAVTSFVFSAVAGFLEARARWPRDVAFRDRIFGAPPLIVLLPLQLAITNPTSAFLFVAVSVSFYLCGIEFWSRRHKRDDGVGQTRLRRIAASIAEFLRV